jgi:hypothetical protein
MTAASDSTSRVFGSQEGAALDEVAEGLLEEEGVASGALGEELGHGLGQLALRSVADEDPGRVGGERPHLYLAVAVRVTLARSLAESPRAVVALGPVEEEEGDGGLVRDAEERLEQLQRRLVGPVEVLEDETERLLVRQPADELVERLEGA